jgi:hypothetical protein
MGKVAFKYQLERIGHLQLDLCLKSNYIRFDRPLLEYLSTRINLGQVYPKEIESEDVSSTWEVAKKTDLLKLIEIFDKHPLNTTKYLDYLLWREAWFYVRKQTFVFTFGLGQTITQKVVIEAIAQFLNNLIPEDLPELKK